MLSNKTFDRTFYIDDDIVRDGAGLKNKLTGGMVYF